MKKAFIADGQKIQDNIRRKLWMPLLLILIAGACLFLAAFFCDICSIAHGNPSAGNIAGFYDTLVAITTILAAAVIFFYSMQDYKKGGIPNRTILAYTAGSFAIPVFFILTMVLLPVIYFAFHIGMGITGDMGTILAYMFQILIIGLIVLSNSYAFSISIICNTEIKQYKELCKLEDRQEKSNKKLEKNPQFIWTYLMHHLEQVVISDDLIADKMTLLRRMLGIPFYKKEFFGWGILHTWEKRNPSNYVMHMDKAYLEKNHLRRIYEFYYGNFSSAMGYLGKEENVILRNKVYLVIYEFLKNLSDLYQKTEKSNDANENYLMTVTGIMNAVLDNAIEDAEGFCNYILNKCIADELRFKQMGLYFFLQEYLYRTPVNDSYKSKIFLRHLNEIRDITQWELKPEDEASYWKFWLIWMEWTTISNHSKRIYFYNAMATLKGEKRSSLPLSYIKLSIKAIKEKS